MTRTRTGIGAIILATLALGACAKPTGPAEPPGPASPSRPADRRLVDEGYSGRFRVSGTVLESPSHGPQLCHSVMDSLPPQCGGPDIVGWHWKAVKSESANGTRWGSYTVTGTYDAAKNRFTLTEPASERVESTGQPDTAGPSFDSPCATPAGGWRPVDPAKATMDAENSVIGIARSDPDFGGLWLDQSYIQPGDPVEASNDPKKYVLNVTFTKDLARHEAQLRKVWGGALCVSKAARSMAQMERMRGEVEPTVKGMLYSSIDEVTNVLTITVPVATTAQQRDFDSRYGDGAVALASWFQPID